MSLLAHLRASSARLGMALVYHRVEEKTGNPDFELVPALSVKSFTAQARHVKQHYRLTLASELPAAVARRRRGERIPLAISFDDDLATHANVVAPLLAHEAIPATFFVGSCTVPPSARYWWDHLQDAVDNARIDPSMLPHLSRDTLLRALDRRPGALRAVAREIESLAPDLRQEILEYLRSLPDQHGRPGLSCEDLRALAASGFEIGFHTVPHHRVTGLDDEALRTVLIEGRAELETLVGPVEVFAYPHGKAGPREAGAVARAGYPLAFTTRREPITRRSDPHLLGRLEPPFAAGGAFALSIARLLHSSRRVRASGL